MKRPLPKTSALPGFCAPARFLGWSKLPTNSRNFIAWFLSGICAVVAEAKVAAASGPSPAPSAPIDFSQVIQPLFAERCYSCHGPEKQKSGLRLDIKSGALKGGDSGRVIVPGHSAESRLFQLVAGLDSKIQMPAKGPPLTQEHVARLRTWIDQGANWPETNNLAASRVRNSHWSLQPIPSSATTAARLPAASPDKQRVKHVATGASLRPYPPSRPIDRFVQARLLTNGLTLSPSADRATLIRRVTFDLTGLPPTPEEVASFVSDPSATAYEKLVDRLLDSPHYGERWGRHWLDVARYTESQGFEYDKLRDNAWHYRDYVIRSFNEDKPYNQFMREQIAGDVLEPSTRDGIVGASLLVCGPWDEAGNAQANATQKAITREEEMEDLLSVVGQTFLGLTLNCARCHSHKFDPIPQEDYYRVKAVFDGVKHGERAIATLAEEKARADQIAALKRTLSEASARATQLEQIGWQRVAHQHDLAKTNGLAPMAIPAPFRQWRFDRLTNASGLSGGTLQGAAVIRDGALQLSSDGGCFQSEPLDRDIREKTLEAWVNLSSLDQGGGAAISIESDSGSVFDAIVFGERQARKWMAGSEGFVRTRDLDTPEETSSPNTRLHLAIVYREDRSIAIFRNGQPYGSSYVPTNPLQLFPAGRTRVLLGKRHTGGSRPYLDGSIIRAAIYDRALNRDEIQASFQSSGWAISKTESIAALNPTERAEYTNSLALQTKLQKAVAEIPALPVSYAGTRLQPTPTHRLKRGDVNSPEELVPPSGLSAVVDLDPNLGLAPDAPEGQRRQRFAAWLSDPRNPLPARVVANRIWHYHFGQGIVTTPNDFGVAGARPSHPELLDWLAASLIESGWSIKTLQRLIVNSETYRQASAVSPASAKAVRLDADNQLLWHYAPRRLEAEAVRDAMLAVSGQLNPAMGGPSYRPFEALKFPANSYQPTDKLGAEFNRRTVYRMNVNSGKEPLLDSFDCPDPSVKTPRRGITTTPLQALELMNNSFVQRQAAALAVRAQSMAPGDRRGAIRAAYQLALGRDPTAPEIQSALKVMQERDRSFTNVCWALLNSTEFVYVR